MTSQVRVDNITNLADNGPNELSQGAIVPSGKPAVILGNVNLSGICTVGFTTSSNIIVGVMTASLFAGDASRVTNIPATSHASAIALAIISS